MFDPASLRFRGPLAAHAQGLLSYLDGEGYAPFSVVQLLRLTAQVSRWLDDQSLPLTEEHVAQFFAHRRRQGYSHHVSPRALRMPLQYLRSVGALPAATVSVSPAERLLADYANYLERERGLAASTIVRLTKEARRIVGRLGLEWDQLKAADVVGYVVRQARKRVEMSPLRSLLRFLHLRGLTARDLSMCVPPVARWRLAALPKGLEPDQIKQLLHTCDRRSVVGSRDLAVLLLLVRLGLRAGDVAALVLDDVDWRAGEIRVSGKGRREDRLPLPADVGRALARYLLRGRPQVPHREIFIRALAPLRPMSATAISLVARDALRRIGVTAGGSHVLRHTAATQMLRRGASLSEIAHVLRHRRLDTTAIYAKVDYAALRMVIQPWPEGAV